MIKNMPPVILDMLEDFNLDREVILNYGSSTPDFYQKQQPFIWWDLMVPLEYQGALIINVDPKPSAVQLQSTMNLPAGWFKFILLNSVLEHVNNVDDVLNDVHELLNYGGILIASCPSEWPYHPDPIDNMLRVRTEEEWEFLLGGRFEIQYFREVTDDRGKETIVKAEKIA